MHALEIKKNIHWVGVVDHNSRDFHGYSLSPQGTTYNAYVVMDEKVTLFDTVKHEFLPTLLCRLSQVVEPEKIDYIVCNHLEPDHAGALAEIVARCKPEKIFCSPMGLKAMEAHFDITGWPVQVVKTGDSISLGKRTVTFVETRMLHWPDSMVSYIPEDKLLICNDAFGQNIASTERYADEIDRSALLHAMKEYYHNIVLPFSPIVLKTLDAIAELKLDIDMLAPDHGLIFRGYDEVQFAFDTYRRYAEQKPQKRAVVVFDTMWHSTEKMAHAIADGLEAGGVPTRIMWLKANHHSAVMTELADCGAVIVGSPTHNNGILPEVAKMLTYMKGLRPQNRIGAAFGSFGWSGESVKAITEWLESMGMELPAEAVKVKHVPTHDTYGKCFELGKTVAAALTAKCEG
ncbi:FprA family A-type flavoprotein [Nitratidesulfovibrio liaohensis]|uniref:FprA family A-type flavoprotein n=1 Tax=Nitratidesulfovibrio liaohensis TaxID=2604158 RepID=A0ABY9R035_9BACT|nr:FprA family A-type flavoprotein [Nitratidesulfovibrio liaohensis]WMW64819.1 FprA family A-type flavoprotein [Nitratidesulfovibrio liaohensis]